MKKLIFKTASITLGVILVLAISVFGIMSFVAPSAMMRFFDSIGLESISGDYAYQQYQISGNIDYLARSFEIAAIKEKDSVASERFNEFYGEEGSDRRQEFLQYCRSQNQTAISSGNGFQMPQTVLNSDYRSYVCAQAALVKYRLSTDEEEKAEVCDFAISETDAEITPLSPLIALVEDPSVLADSQFCAMLLQKMRSEEKFNRENEFYVSIIKSLEEAFHE